MLDETDRRILRNLLQEPSLSHGALAEKSHITAAQVTRRLLKLKEQGVLLGQEAHINWAALGYVVEVSLRITLDKARERAFDEFIEAAREIPEVLDIQTFLGSVDIRLGVIAKSMVHYQSLYRDKILHLPNIADIEALMHISQVKAKGVLPL